MASERNSLPCTGSGSPQYIALGRHERVPTSGCSHYIKGCIVSLKSAEHMLREIQGIIADAGE